MTTHYHLLFTTPDADLAEGMRHLNWCYARSFNARYRGNGHVFEGPYGAELIQTEAHLLETYRYIAMNPVRAGICDRPDEWPWSSYRESLGLEPAPLFIAAGALLDLFGGEVEDARARFRNFVEDRLP